MHEERHRSLLEWERGRGGAITQQRKEKGSAERRAGSIWAFRDNTRLSAEVSGTPVAHFRQSLLQLAVFLA
jgi:hypothetical protein